MMKGISRFFSQSEIRIGIRNKIKNRIKNGIGTKLLSVYMILALMAAALTGCGNIKSMDNKTIRIGVSVYDIHDTFITQLMDEFNSYADTDVTIVTYNAGQSIKEQNNQMQEMIDTGCDVICINLVDRTEPEHIIDMALKYDVPVIFFNRELTKEDLQRSSNFYYVGSDAVESGIMQGELAADEILGQGSAIDTNNDGNIQYVMLQGEAGHQDAIVRSEYCVETLINKGVQLDRQGLAIANFNRTQAQSKIEQLISSNTEIELILANNDDMALGAIDAYLNMYGEDAKSKIPAIYGIDGTIGGLEAVKTGYMHGTVYNDKEGQAHAMYDLAMALATGSSLDGLGIEDGHYIRLPHTKITLDNVNDFLYR